MECFKRLPLYGSVYLYISWVKNKCHGWSHSKEMNTFTKAPASECRGHTGQGIKGKRRTDFLSRKTQGMRRDV